MQFIQGNNRHQTYFSPLEDQVITDNAVRLMDALLISWGYSNLVSVKSKSEGRPPYAPAVLVNGEMNLIMFCYNFMRTKNIPGFEKMLKAIENWKPDYSKVVCTFKNGFFKLIYSQMKPLLFSNLLRLSFLKAA